MRDSDEPSDDERQRVSLKGIVRASGLAVLLGLAARKEKRSLHPQVVRGGPEVDAVIALADELAEQGRDDEGAVRKLRSAGKAGRPESRVGDDEDGARRICGPVRFSRLRISWNACW